MTGGLVADAVPAAIESAALSVAAMELESVLRLIIGSPSVCRRSRSADPRGKPAYP
jgi:hypothetical protein